jgi:YD repeat-containing protein
LTTLFHAVLRLSLTVCALNVQANPGDGKCFGLFREAGAVPGTQECFVAAQNADVGLSTFYCTAGPSIARRYCSVVPKDKGDKCDDTPAPIAIGTGNKTLYAADHGSGGAGTLSFVRHYNSSASTGPGSALGVAWRSNFDAGISAMGSGMAAYRPDGRIVYFALLAGAYRADADVKDRLARVVATGEWLYTDAASRTMEVYDPSGRLQSVQAASGGMLSLVYSNATTPITIAPGAGYLISVSDSFGRTLAMTYNSTGRMTAVVMPNSSVITFGYDGESRLAEVSFPDAFVLSYRYDEPAYTDGVSLPDALTGIFEDGVRMAEHFYANTGHAVVSQKLAAAGVVVSRHALSYSGLASEGPSGNSTVTDPSGTSRTYAFSRILGTAKRSALSQPGGAGCAASSSAQTFDPNGNVSSRDDFNGHRMCLVNDPGRNLEATRVEGLPTATSCSDVTGAGAALVAGSRKLSTQWHPTWSLRTRVAEPGRITTWVYNGQPDPYAGGAVASCAPGTALLPDGKPIAVLCRQVEQATEDSNGALGFAAPLQAGVPLREQRWTYNQDGQMLTHDGPRTDVTDITVNQYYSDTSFAGTGPGAVGHTRGDLAQTTSPALHTTRYPLYNKTGQLMQSVDPNDVIAQYTYDQRQRLSSTKVGVQLATYSYWPNGLLKRVTQADTSWLQHGYDGAHRLTGITDNLGNSISYTLDNLGNRTAERVRDPGNALRRLLGRSIDALGRVQQVTGRE